MLQRWMRLISCPGRVYNLRGQLETTDNFLNSALPAKTKEIKIKIKIKWQNWNQSDYFCLMSVKGTCAKMTVIAWVLLKDQQEVWKDLAEEESWREESVRNPGVGSWFQLVLDCWTHKGLEILSGTQSWIFWCLMLRCLDLLL